MVSARTKLTLGSFQPAVVWPCVASLPGCPNSLVPLFWLSLDGLHMRGQRNCAIGKMAAENKTTKAKLHEESGGDRT